MVFAACKQELEWTDYQFTNFQHIERWWEIIFCVSTMISLNSPVFLALNQSLQIETDVTGTSCASYGDFSHQQWNHDSGWKNTLNNLRLIVNLFYYFG